MSDQTDVRKFAKRGICQLAFTFTESRNSVLIRSNSKLWHLLLSQNYEIMHFENIPVFSGRIFQMCLEIIILQSQVEVICHDPFIFSLHKENKELLEFFDDQREICFFDLERAVSRDTIASLHGPAYPVNLDVGKSLEGESNFLPNIISHAKKTALNECEVNALDQNYWNLRNFDRDEETELKSILLAQTRAISGAGAQSCTLEKAKTFSDFCECSGRGKSIAYHELFPFIYLLKSGLPLVKTDLNLNVPLLSHEFSSALNSLKPRANCFCPTHADAIKTFLDTINFEKPVNILVLHQFLGFLMNSTGPIKVSRGQILDLSLLLEMPTWKDLFFPVTPCSLASFSDQLHFNMKKRNVLEEMCKFVTLFHTPGALGNADKKSSDEKKSYFDKEMVCPKLMCTLHCKK